jgi:hypothetical protein
MIITPHFSFYLSQFRVHIISGVETKKKKKTKRVEEFILMYTKLPPTNLKKGSVVIQLG